MSLLQSPIQSASDRQFAVIIESPRGRAVLWRATYAEAKAKADLIAASEIPVRVESAAQAERSFAPMNHYQPKGRQINGWDV